MTNMTDSMEDDDDDTVVGTCLHCNAPPPPRSSSRGGGSSTTFSGGGGSGPCSANSISATSAATSPSAATRVQVSCDDCRSFICDGCHWCHEFQANHEIRVCDRCDAFYCRGCDEMDQCEDCSEVVCNTCSTLMSCKFCGCGLCEDCATACGRCGIVLCARDAKFAVECDTCRMSYCLVCLASGTKDPCVRCGHRPSKRVEQLVHLRLKSIYKAFKQSGASVGPGSGNGGGSGSSSGSSGGCRSDGSGRDGSTMGGKYSSALRSLTENNNSSDSSKDNFTNFDQNMASEVAAVLQTASNSMANSDGDFSDGHSRRARGKRISAHDHSPSSGSARNRSSSRVSNAAAERYFRKTQADMEAAAAAAEAEAEAAAEALLAELDEEKASSNAATSRKSKKKKKKKEKKKEAEGGEEQTALESFSSDNVKSEDKDDKNPPTQKKKGSKKAPWKSSKDPPPIDDDSSDEEMNFEQLVAGAKSSNRPSKKEKKEENSEENKTVSPPPQPKPEPPPPVEADPVTPATTADFDAELAILLSNEDEEGLETFLANLKGVPGLGAARKTAKKALKRIREAKQPPVSAELDKSQTQSSNANSSASNVETETKPTKVAAKAAPRASSAAATPTTSTTNPTPPPSSGTQHEPLLRVVSRTQSNVGTTSSRGGSSNSSSVPAAARAECVMHMSPAVVGWVIGKGGSRIRDMMEESGAKIWIDQESMGAKEARVVYVSGKRSGVDSAVRMVKDLVAKAPVAASAAASTGVAPAPAPASSAAKSAPVPSSSPSVQNPSPVEAAKEPASFAAAITSGAAAVTPPAPNPATPTKQPAPTQQWALPTSSGNTHAAPPQAAPQSVKAAVPKPAVRSALEAGGAKLFPDTMTSELACDPRFVALLIGRRGWTVKNIQAESGADLHIDQAVDPPKIIISGKAEHVKKAEQLVREVLKYPHAQLHQETPSRPDKNVMMGATDSNMGIATRSDQNVGDSQMMMNKPMNPSPMPLPTSLHRDISSSTPQLLGELQLQQESSHQTTVVQAEAVTNLPPGYPQYQQQQNQTNMGLFQESSSTVARISEFLPHNQHQPMPPTSVNVDQHARTQSQEGWAQAPMRTQYSALPPFSSAHVSTSDQYSLSNPNPPLSHQHPNHQPPYENVSRRPPSSFALPPPDQHLHFPQNVETVHQASMPPAQAPSTRINDFMSTGNSNRDMNGWEVPANGTAMGGTWNQSGHHAPVVSTHQQPSFQAQAVPPPLSNNPFQPHTQNQQFTTSSSLPTKSDDAQMVDDLFASLGTSAESDGSGLLNALNSVSLGGATSQQGNWGSNITGWTGEESSSFLQNSRLGDYREEE